MLNYAKIKKHCGRVLTVYNSLNGVFTGWAKNLYHSTFSIFCNKLFRINLLKLL